MGIALSVAVNKRLRFEFLSIKITLQYLRQIEFYWRIFIGAKHSLIDKTSIHLINWESNRFPDIFFEFELRHAKFLNIVHVSNRVILEWILEKADSCDIEERCVVFPRDPECTIIFINEIYLFLCCRCPFVRLITPITSPFLFAPRVTYFAKSLFTTTV